jgi:hypothetical protein
MTTYPAGLFDSRCVGRGRFLLAWEGGGRGGEHVNLGARDLNARSVGLQPCWSTVD